MAVTDGSKQLRECRAGISYRVKRLIIEYLLPIVAQLTPIINTLAPDQQQCTTLVLLVDLVEVIDATISSVALCPSWGRGRRLWRGFSAAGRNF